MPRLVKRRLGQSLSLGDAGATEIFREDLLPDGFDFSSIPGALFAEVTLPKRMPTPLKLTTTGDIEKMKADGVKAYAIIIYVHDGTQWRLRHRSERDCTIAPAKGKPDVMLGCSLELGPSRDSQLSERRIVGILQVIGGTADIGIDIESG